MSLPPLPPHLFPHFRPMCERLFVFRNLPARLFRWGVLKLLRWNCCKVARWKFIAAGSGKMLSWSFSLLVFLVETTSDQPSNLKKFTPPASSESLGIKSRWGRIGEEYATRTITQFIVRATHNLAGRRTVSHLSPRERLRLRISEKEGKKSGGKIETNSIYLHTQQMVEIYISRVSEGEKNI